MKVLFFCRLFHPHIGGVEKYVYELSMRLKKRGISVTIVTERHEKRLSQYEVIDGIDVYRIPIPRNERLKKFAIWYWFFKHLFLFNKADIIHCHDVFYWYLPFRFFYFRKPVYTTFQGYESYPVKQKAIFVRKIAQILSWGNICTGKFIEKWYKTKATILCYGGIAIERSTKSPSSRKSAVFVGRLDEQTSVQTYLDAIKDIVKHVPDFSLAVVGDGKLRPKVERYAKVLGFKKELTKYFEKYNYAFVSRYLTMLEAMVDRRLVFAVYDNPLKEDYLRKSPFAKYIVIVGSGRELSEKVQYFLKYPEKEKKLVYDAEHWAKTQTWDRVADVYLKLWRYRKGFK